MAVSKNMEHFFNAYSDTLQKYDLYQDLLQVAQANYYSVLSERLRAPDFVSKYKLSAPEIGPELS